MSDLTERETQAQHRLQRLEVLEADILAREVALKRKESAKKQVLLRLAPSLWVDIATWAEDDMRSINGQIEYLLTQAVKQRKGK